MRRLSMAALFSCFDMLKRCACQGLVGARDSAECSQHPDVHCAWLLTWLVLTQQIEGQDGLHQLYEAVHGNSMENMYLDPKSR